LVTVFLDNSVGLRPEPPDEDLDIRYRMHFLLL
jgi:hypothetical protein